jgi:MFS family permease
MLVPLYLLIVADLHLGGVKAASLIVTVYGLVYCAGSYVSGMLADRFNRKWLLGIGLVANAVVILAMGLTRRYDVLLMLGVLGGVAGTLFHPAANALVPAHFPKTPGLAIGLLGAGSGLGFFAGPQFAGLRARHGGWHLGQIADWQRPLVELGLAGIAFGVLFLLFAREAPGRHGKAAASAGPRGSNGQNGRTTFPERSLDLPSIRFGASAALNNGNDKIDYAPLAIDAEHTLGPALWHRTAFIAAVLGCRDFAGVAGITLASIYLQKAHGLNVAQAGFFVGTMMLLSAFVSPLAVWLTPGRRRLPALVGVLLTGGAICTATPFVPLRWTLAILCAFQTCQLSSYSISDAAMLERVAPAVRGRFVGLFLTIAGTFASTGPWIMGWWTDSFGPRGAQPLAYLGPFGLLGAMLVAATFSIPLIARLGQPDQTPIEPLSETMPVTLGPIG